MRAETVAFALPALPYGRLCESSSSFARASVRVTAAVAREGCWGRDAIVASRNCRSQVEAMAPTSWANDAWSNLWQLGFFSERLSHYDHTGSRR